MLLHSGPQVVNDETIIGILCDEFPAYSGEARTYGIN